MEVYVVYQGWQNDSEQVIAIYKHENDAKDRVKEEEILRDESRIYFYYEPIELFEGRDIVRDKEVAML